MNVITKSVDAAVRPVESDRPNGQAEVILSTEGLDRDGENLWVKEWKTPLPGRIHIDGDHGRSLDKTVGSCVPRIEGNQMVGTVDFAGTPYGQMVRQLVNEGHVDKLSVTYGESKDKDGNIQRELFNAAFVAIPANPEAVVLASKSAKVALEDWLAKRPVDRPSVDAHKAHMSTKVDKDAMDAAGDDPQVPKHDDMVQAIHDAACHLGAMCANEIAADPGTADGANKSVGAVYVDVIPLRIKSGLITASEAREIRLADKSSSESAGPPQESAEESAVPAAAEKSAAAGTAEESAEETVKAKAAKSRALAFLITKNTPEEG